MHTAAFLCKNITTKIEYHKPLLLFRNCVPSIGLQITEIASFGLPTFYPHSIKR